MNKTVYYSPTNIFGMIISDQLYFLDVNINDGVQDGCQNVDFR